VLLEFRSAADLDAFAVGDRVSYGVGNVFEDIILVFKATGGHLADEFLVASPVKPTD
jgi:hypothetical protein